MGAVATGCAVTGIPKMADASDVAVSGDGRNVYATSFGSDSITRFDRDPATGNLTRAGCITSGMGCGTDLDDGARLRGRRHPGDRGPGLVARPFTTVSC